MEHYFARFLDPKYIVLPTSLIVTSWENALLSVAFYHASLNLMHDGWHGQDRTCYSVTAIGWGDERFYGFILCEWNPERGLDVGISPNGPGRAASILPDLPRMHLDIDALFDIG